MELEMGERWAKWNYQPSKEHLLKGRSQKGSKQTLYRAQKEK